MSFRIAVWGDYALFTRPEMKVERVSYDVMTPSAARGIMDAIYWHPGMRWVIDRIYVCKPIHFDNIRRNEVKATTYAYNARLVMSRGEGELWLATSNSIQQRASMLLRDVHYVIDAHFEMTEKSTAEVNAGKFSAIIERRLRRGQCYHQPCLGCREFPANFAACEEIPPCPESLKGDLDLGYMLYDMDYSDPENIKPLFFRATLHDGVLTIPPRTSEEVRG